MLEIDRKTARRLALYAAGLLKPAWAGLPRRSSGRGKRSRSAARAVIAHFGYLQLDSVSVAGARTHGIVLASRLEGFPANFAEELLQPGEPLFEYWGHEASWLPLELYPAMAFRREEFRVHPWWGNLLGDHSEVADGILSTIEKEGPIRSVDTEGEDGPGGWWSHRVAKKVLVALWSAGELAVRERRGFQRSFDLSERVIPEDWRRDLPEEEAFEQLAIRALAGHGWATRGTIAATWRLRGRHDALNDALERLRRRGIVQPCRLRLEGSATAGRRGGARRIEGWILVEHLELLDRLRRARPPKDRGVLLSPFDPLLWDRRRVELLFGFEQKIEIYKPAEKRRYGYYCLPVLAGDRLVGRVDLKAHRPQRIGDPGRLEPRAVHFEHPAPSAARRQALRQALERYAEQVELPLGRAGSE
ncbi:MAG: winged helix DNA-binding domain-containing protein [Holophagales bacterium]|nr:winged helix DNA-binding domain-containing protein [Holophagales bacterium]